MEPQNNLFPPRISGAAALTRRRWFPPVVAALTLAGAVAWDVILDHLGEPEFPSAGYVIPVVVAAILGGERLGIISALVSLLALASDTAPFLGSRPFDSHEVVRLVFFAAAAASTIYLSARLRQANSRSEARRQQFADLFTLNPAGSALVRLKDLTLIAANDAYLRTIGWTRYEAIGRSVRELQTLDTADRARMMAQAQRSDGVHDEAITFLRRDGSLRQGRMSMRMLTIDDEPHVLGVLTDVTEARRTEAALRTSDERFKELAETINEVFWMTDPAKGEMLFISPAYEKIWGRSCESLYRSPKDWLDAIHPDDRGLVLNALERQAKDGGYDEQYRIIRPDGGVRWIRDRAFPVKGASGNVARIAGVAEDITERRELEAQLRQTQKLESVVMLAGGVAHDFNNLLTVIQANAEMLADAPTLAELRETVGEIRSATERGASLTRQLLAFSRQEMLEPKVVNINAVLNDTSKMLRRLIGEDVELITNLASDVSPVMIDPGHFAQVLMNLAVNARDAMPKGGRLSLRTLNLTVSRADAIATGRKHGRYVAITVADTGQGMLPEVRARIFEPFFTTKGQGRGTGLGLAVVHGIVSQSGGHIEVDSTPGLGTTFTILLPAAKEGVRLDLADEELPKGGTETVLLVEDEDTVRRVASRALTANGYTVIAAHDGVDALNLMSKVGKPIDLLLTDVVMPRMDGRTLAETVLSAHPVTRVIYTSGYTDDAVVRHGVMRAEVHFLQKPYTISVLLKKVRHALDTAPASPGARESSPSMATV